MSAWLLPFVWLINGVMALVWMMVDHLWQVGLAVALGYAVLHAPEPQKQWSLGVALLALLAGIFAPFPVALFMLIMVIAGVIAVRLERINPQNTHWIMIRGLGLYALTGLGFSAYQELILPALSDPALVGGQAYITVIASYALYLVPLGYLALLAQEVLVHPPIQQNPDEIIYRFRSRGKP
jgi:hypothetical protein